MRDSIRLGARVTGSLILALVGAHLVAGTSAAIRFLDRNRPAQSQLSSSAFIESQALHIEALADVRDIGGKVVFAGSSSVVNGVDVSLIKAKWTKRGLPVTAANYGMTSFTAAELPFLKRELLAPDVKLVVFAYNTFSFPDRFHPQAVDVRWNTREFMRAAPLRLILSPAFSISLPIAGETVAAVRFNHLLAETVKLWARGQARIAPTPYDYPDSEPFRPVSEKRLALPRRIDRNDFLEAIYVESDTDAPTLGYRGLERFLELARAAHIPIILMHVPEPDFGYRYGANADRIDAHVVRIASRFGVRIWPRLRSIESNDSLFRDNIHLHPLGRERYSEWLAEAVARQNRWRQVKGFLRDSGPLGKSSEQRAVELHRFVSDGVPSETVFHQRATACTHLSQRR